MLSRYVTIVRVYFLARSLRRRQSAGRQYSALKHGTAARDRQPPYTERSRRKRTVEKPRRSVVLCLQQLAGAV